MYKHFLVPSLPEELKTLLEAGVTVADVGCGFAVSTTEMAKAFPKSKFVGFDNSPLAMTEAQKNKGTLTNVSFTKCDAKDFGGRSDEFDIVCFFDCFHDMSIASRAAQRAFQVLKPSGKVFLIELMAPEKDEIDQHVALPTCAMMSGASCHVCLPCSKFNNGDALGTVVATEKLREVFVKAGFKSLERIPAPLDKIHAFRTILVRK